MEPQAPKGDEHTVLARQGGAPLARASSAADDPLLGVELAGTYRVLGVLGEGGMGRLYDAEHVRLDRRYAVKVIHRPLADRSDLVERFAREARAMSRVQSDHIVDVVDVIEAPDGRQCIVTEKLEGKDLEAHVSGARKLTPSEAVRWVRQACRGASAAHALGVVHRDLKPSNLFLASDAGGSVTLKILDFGVAKIGGESAEVTSTGVIVGTPAFMAPEQARGASSADARSDVYALGAVLYRLVTGQNPYGGSDASTTLIRLLEESPARPSVVDKTVPAGLEAIIEKAMARDPAERFQSADELLVALGPFDEGAHVTVSMRSAAAGEAQAASRRARLARPTAMLAATLISLGAGLSISVALGLLVDGLNESPRIGTPELVLVAIGGLVAVAASGVASWRTLGAVWSNVAMVEAATVRLWRVLASGVVALGVQEIGHSAYTLALMRPAANEPIWAASRVLLALGVGAIVAALGGRKRSA